MQYKDYPWKLDSMIQSLEDTLDGSKDEIDYIKESMQDCNKRFLHWCHERLDKVRLWMFWFHPFNIRPPSACYV